jgi:NADH:ubiquinone oxidoreductase subunit H
MVRFNLDIFDTIILWFSWYIKPLLASEGFLTNLQFTLLLCILSSIIILYKVILTLIQPLMSIFFTVKLTSFLSIFMGLKFIVLLGLLIVVRGGIPRYRYDFLTKLGWIKTLSLVLIIFLINLLLSYL